MGTETVMQVEAVDGEATRVDADLGGFLPCEVDATLWLNGSPLADANVMLLEQAHRRGGLGAASDAEGHLCVLALPGSYRFAWCPPGMSTVYASGTFELTAGGKLTPVLAFSSGELRILLRDADGSPLQGAHVTLLPSDGSEGAALPETDANGNASGHLAPGRYRCQTLPKHLRDAAALRDFIRNHPNDWQQALVPLGEVEVKQGTVTSAELRVPAEEGR
jgi:hypothetical protein